MSEIVKKQFDAVAQSYDMERRQLIPCFDDFYGTATRWVQCSKDAPRILDLGSGTGLFASFIRSKYPNASLTLIDFSQEMLKEAQNRFGEDPNVTYIMADYTNYPFTERYDTIISSLSIHHLTHPDKRKLFKTVFNQLADDGIFVNADQAAGSSSYFNSVFNEQWEQSVRSTGLSAQAAEASLERRKQDRNAPVQDQLDWLQSAGFETADCVFKYNEFAVFVAQKSMNM